MLVTTTRPCNTRKDFPTRVGISTAGGGAGVVMSLGCRRVREYQETWIARQLDRSDTTIRRRLRQFGIASRPKGPIPLAAPDTSDINWSAERAYAVGLMATDGNLSKKPGQMSLVSKDRDQLETLCRCLNVTLRLSWNRSAPGRLHPKGPWSSMDVRRGRCPVSPPQASNRRAVPHASDRTGAARSRATDGTMTFAFVPACWNRKTIRTQNPEPARA